MPGPCLAASAVIALQLGILCFWWFPYRVGNVPRVGAVLWTFSVIFLVVSLAVIVVPACLFFAIAPMFSGGQYFLPHLFSGVFLLVHVATNIALLSRPRLYLSWMIGVWGTGPIAFMLMHYVMPKFVFDSLADAGRGGYGQDIPLGMFWWFSLSALFGTVVGLPIAWAWVHALQRRHTRPAMPTDSAGSLESRAPDSSRQSPASPA
jgi:hypothetical protein